MSVYDHYACDGQMAFDDYLLSPAKINKKIRLIELFAGVSMQWQVITLYTAQTLKQAISVM